MQSKSVLLIGILFVTLLTTFCITKYINKFNPNIKIIKTPKSEILDNGFETFETNKSEDSYIQIVKLIEEEEKEIEEIYNKALIKASNTREKIKVPKQEVIKKEPIKTVKSQKFTIETILYSQTIIADKEPELSNLQKDKLKEVVQIKNKNSSSILKIEAKKNSKKLYLIKKYLTSLGIPLKDMHIVLKRDKRAISITDTDNETIDILVIKKGLNP